MTKKSKIEQISQQCHYACNILKLEKNSMNFKWPTHHICDHQRNAKQREKNNAKNTPKARHITRKIHFNYNFVHDVQVREAKYIAARSVALIQHHWLVYTQWICKKKYTQKLSSSPREHNTPSSPASQPQIA